MKIVIWHLVQAVSINFVIDSSEPRLLSVENMKTIIGIDIGGTKTAVVEGTSNGEILQRHEIQTETFAQTFPIINQLIENFIRKAFHWGREVIALSISIGGPLKIVEGILINPPHLPGWHGVQLSAEFSQGFPELPIYVEHDGNAGALAEYYFGVGKGRADLQHLIFLTFGTGLGAGIIVNGKIVHGATDTAGEVGHWRLSQQGPVGFGKAGSWEGFASGRGLVLLAHEMFPHRWRSDAPIRKFVSDVLSDDSDALVVIQEAGRWMGRGLALLVDVLNPQVIVLGSLAVVLGDRILASARAVIAEEALPQAVAACEIVPAKLGQHIGDVASLMAALSQPEINNKLSK